VAAGIRADTRITGGRSRSSTIRLSEPAASGFSVGSMELMPSTTRTSVPRRSRLNWSGRWRRRRRQQEWPLTMS
jgi:hypothetical protein